MSLEDASFVSGIVVRCRCHWENICVGKEMGLIIIIIIKALISPFPPESMIAQSQVPNLGPMESLTILGSWDRSAVVGAFRLSAPGSNQMSSVLKGLSLSRRWPLHWTMSCRQASKAAILTFQCCWPVSDRRGVVGGGGRTAPGAELEGRQLRQQLVQNYCFIE